MDGVGASFVVCSKGPPTKECLTQSWQQEPDIPEGNQIPESQSPSNWLFYEVLLGFAAAILQPVWGEGEAYDVCVCISLNNTQSYLCSIYQNIHIYNFNFKIENKIIFKSIPIIPIAII